MLRAVKVGFGGARSSDVQAMRRGAGERARIKKLGLGDQSVVTLVKEGADAVGSLLTCSWRVYAECQTTVLNFGGLSLPEPPRVTQTTNILLGKFDISVIIQRTLALDVLLFGSSIRCIVSRHKNNAGYVEYFFCCHFSN
jgi:hypothetical protein